MVEFLEAKGIEVNNIDIAVTDIQEICNACSCKTGRTICGSVRNEDLDEIKEFGFVEQ